MKTNKFSSCFDKSKYIIERHNNIGGWAGKYEAYRGCDGQQRGKSQVPLLVVVPRGVTYPLSSFIGSCKYLRIMSLSAELQSTFNSYVI